MSKFSHSPLVTVFTPTYNRAYCIHRVIDSLKQQTYQNFEWVVVDDGSTDDTRNLIENVRKECKFKIRYFYQENSGKHNAINKGVEEANGEFIIIADSDDGFKPDTIDVFIAAYFEIPDREKYAGIWCLVEDEKAQIVGDRFPMDNWDCSVKEYYFTNTIEGEKWQMIRTDIMKKFPMPAIHIQGLYVGESIMWMPMSKAFLFRCINVPLRKYYSSDDGIMQTNKKSDTFKWHGYYLQFHYLFKDFGSYFLYSPGYFLKGMILFQYANLKLKKSFFRELLVIKPAFIQFIFLISFFFLPFVMIYKYYQQIAKR